MSKNIINENKLRKLIKEAILDIVSESIDEGIDFDNETLTVSYNPSHEDNVDTSVGNNPTNDNSLINGINVWSIFKRKRGERGDGNPLVYALKREKGWKFRSPKDEIQIKRQINSIALKFVTMYPVGITILIPSGSELNTYIAKVVISLSDDAELLEGALCKLTTEEVDDIVMQPCSKF
jgi:hypothetical protein